MGLRTSPSVTNWYKLYRMVKAVFLVCPGHLHLQYFYFCNLQRASEQRVSGLWSYQLLPSWYIWSGSQESPYWAWYQPTLCYHFWLLHWFAQLCCQVVLGLWHQEWPGTTVTKGPHMYTIGQWWFIYNIFLLNACVAFQLLCFLLSFSLSGPKTS